MTATPSKPSPSKRTRTPLIAIAALLLGLFVVALIVHYRAYIFSAPPTHDLTWYQRKGVLLSTISRNAVWALREDGALVRLTTADIAVVGASRCVGELDCDRYASRWRRGMGDDHVRSCKVAVANIDCAYEVRHRDGRPAVALAGTRRGEGHPALPDLSRRSSDHDFTWVSFRTYEKDVARARLCDMGWCEAGAIARIAIPDGAGRPTVLDAFGRPGPRFLD